MYINSTYLWVVFNKYFITFINLLITRGLDGEQFSEQRYLTLDAVTRVDVYLSYANLGEDVFGYLISFPLPRNIFIHRLVLPQSVSDETQLGEGAGGTPDLISGN